jgi:ketosteroid isomerase-like protein
VARRLGRVRYEPEELIHLTDGVLLLGRMIGTGATSGAGFEREWAGVYTVSAGQVIREQVWFDRQEALEAVGLRE